jgi:hypothetical protein
VRLKHLKDWDISTVCVRVIYGLNVAFLQFLQEGDFL